MKKSNRHVGDILQIIFSAGILISSIFLILDWKRYDICFSICFGMAALLFFTRGVCCVTEDTKANIRYLGAAGYFLVTAVFGGFLCGSILTSFFL